MSDSIVVRDRYGQRWVLEDGDWVMDLGPGWTGARPATTWDVLEADRGPLTPA